jgi:hypothetical protein
MVTTVVDVAVGIVDIVGIGGEVGTDCGTVVAVECARTVVAVECAVLVAVECAVLVAVARPLCATPLVCVATSVLVGAPKPMVEPIQLGRRASGPPLTLSASTLAASSTTARKPISQLRVRWVRELPVAGHHGATRGIVGTLEPPSAALVAGDGAIPGT